MKRVSQSAERKAWFDYAKALSDERELLRRQAYYAERDERPSSFETCAAAEAVDAARNAVRALNINPFTGHRMNQRGRDIKPRSA